MLVPLLSTGAARIKEKLKILHSCFKSYMNGFFSSVFFFLYLRLSFAAQIKHFQLHFRHECKFSKPASGNIMKILKHFSFDSKSHKKLRQIIKVHFLKYAH